MGMDAKERRARATGLDCHEGRPTCRRRLRLENLSKLPDCGSIEQRCQRQLDLEFLFDSNEELNSQDRVAAKIEVVLVGADRFNGKHVLPNTRESTDNVALGSNNSHC